jgi:hypothetical protein
VEVRDQDGAPLDAVPIRAGEIVEGESFGDWPVDTTDVNGRAEFTWRPFNYAGPHLLQVGVYEDGMGHGYGLLAADTAHATVNPGPPERVEFSPDGGMTLFLGESVDLAPTVGRVTDWAGNEIAVESVALSADPPFLVTGTTVTSLGEVNAPVQVLINGTPIDYPLHFRRDLRSLAGATGGWACESSLGSPTGNPELTLLRREVAVQVDSVVLPGLDRPYDFYMTASWQDRFSDGSTGSGSAPHYKRALVQWPGGWLFEYGPEMMQTSLDPLRYVADRADECATWMSDGTGVNHQAFWLVR